MNVTDKRSWVWVLTVLGASAAPLAACFPAPKCGVAGDCKPEDTANPNDTTEGGDAITCMDLDCEADGRVCVVATGDAAATCGECLPDHRLRDDACLPGLPAPAHLAASTDRSRDVEVRWDAVEGAIGYRLYRCRPIAVATCTSDDEWTPLPNGANDGQGVVITSTAFIDDTVQPPAMPGAPVSTVASKDKATAVEVSWLSVTAPPAPRYRYRVIAVDTEGLSPPSSEIDGGTAERPVSGYEVQRDGGLWASVPGGLVTHWQDPDAGPATLGIGVPSASLATYAEFVRLVVSVPSPTPGPAASYAVRAITPYGPGPASPGAAGWRVAGPLTTKWERSVGPNADGFVVLEGAVTASYDDVLAPANGEVRWYRLTLEAQGAHAVVSSAVPGARKAPPTVPGGVTATNDLADRVSLRWLPVPGATGYRVFRDGKELTSGNGVTATGYDDFAATAPPVDWDAPGELVASNDDVDKVALSWIPPTRPVGPSSDYVVQAVNDAGAGPISAKATGRRAARALVGYEVEIGRDQSPTWVATGSSESQWIDLEPPLGAITVGNGGMAIASQGAHRAEVRVIATDAIVHRGAMVSYRVRGVLDGGAVRTPASESASGSRATGQLVAQWERSAAAAPSDFGVVAGANGLTFFDNDAPRNGVHRWYRLVLTAAGAERLTLVPVEGWRLAFTAMAGGTGHACALSTEGLIWCWGFNGSGNLGFGNFDEFGSPAPSLMPPGVTRFAGLTTGESHTCARTSQGAAWCWGYNDFGQLGDGTKLSRSEPSEVLGLSGPVLAIESGNASESTCALTNAGTVQCWGYNEYGQLGNNSTATSTAPMTVLTAPGTPLTGVLEVAVGALFACARRANDVYCWGHNDSGELGNQSQVPSHVAVKVTGVAAVSELALGESHACARLAGGTVKCWGANASGQLGDGTTTTPRLIPVTVENLSAAAELSSAGDATCARLLSGTVYCWGHGAEGELGNGLNANEPAPSIVDGVAATTIGSGYAFVCAVVDGGLACWGASDNRQLGDGVQGNQNRPIVVSFP